MKKKIVQIWSNGYELMMNNYIVSNISTILRVVHNQC